MRSRSNLSLSNQRGGRLVVGLLGLLLALGFAALSLRDLPVGQLAQPGAAVFPLFCAAFAAVASVGVIWEQWRDSSGGELVDLPRGANLRRLLGVAAGITAYVVLVPALGHLIASFILAVVLVRLLKPAPWRSTLMAAAALSVGIWALFVLGLDVPLPAGVIAEMMR